MSVTIDYSSKAFVSSGGMKIGTITGSDIDVSSGQYFEFTPTADTTFAFSNAPASGTAAGFALAVTGVNVTAGYDLANASSDSKTFSVATQETFTQGLAFNNDGSKLYVVPGSTVQEFSLSTPFDVSTAGSSVNTAFSNENVGGQDIAFSDDGSKLYYIADSTNIAIYQYTLSTPFDVSTRSYDSVSFDLSSQTGSATALEISSDGSNMLVTGRSNDTIFKYTLSTPFDLSTMSYSGISFGVGGADGTPWGMTVGNNGTKMYIVGSNNNTVTQYSISGSAAVATFTYPASVDWPGGTAPDAPANGETDVLVFYTDDGGTTYQGFKAGDAMA